MDMLLYDAYLLITKNRGKNFSVIKFQIENTFNIRTDIFINKEKAEIKKAIFKVKSQIILKISNFKKL